MAVQPSVQRLAPRVGTVGIYAGGAGLELVRETRALAGHVTVSGMSGLKTVAAMARAGDLHDVDLDPAVYLKRGEAPPMALLEEDWEAYQQFHGLSVIRSPGVYVHREDRTALDRAFNVPVRAGTVRVISLHGWWLGARGLPDLLTRIRGCDDPLAFVLAAIFDPLDGHGAVDGLRAVVELASAGRRRVELLRTDFAAIGFAVSGGTLGAIGMGTSTRHHSLPMPRKTQDEYEQRQRSPYVLVRPVLSWQQGTRLGALEQHGGAGLTDCPCRPCDGRSLLRFDRLWPGRPPTDVIHDLRAHDLRTTVRFTQEILRADNPGAAWVDACRAANTAAKAIEVTHKVVLNELPAVITRWR